MNTKTSNPQPQAVERKNKHILDESKSNLGHPKSNKPDSKNPSAADKEENS